MASLKKPTLSREFCYIPATLFLALGAALMTKANFGLSSIIAPAYLLSEILHVSFGTAEYCLQGVLVLVICLIVRKFRWTYLLSFVSAFLYGMVLDGFLWLVGLTGEWGIPLRLLMMAVGMLCSAVGVTLYFKTYLAPCAYELFVKVVSGHFGINIGKFKIVYDGVCCLIAIVLAWLLSGSLLGILDHGIGLGTVLVAFFNGLLINFVTKMIDRFFNFRDWFPFAKYFED